MTPDISTEDRRGAFNNAPAVTTPKIGFGVSFAHHGELTQGVFEFILDRLTRALATLPCPRFKAEARFFPDESGTIIVEPVWKVKAASAAKLALQMCGASATAGGRLVLESTIPLRLGMGSSTADVVAAIRAVADAYRITLSPAKVGKLAVRAEHASDSLMVDDGRVVLFAHREGVIFEDLGGVLPPLTVVGLNTDTTNEGVDTLAFPRARYDSATIGKFRALHGALRSAVQNGDVGLLGRVATASARINEQFLPKPRFSEIARIADTNGAVGVQVAHSGSVVGVLLDAEDPASRVQARSIERRIEALGFSPYVFQTFPCQAVAA